jgi:hypothetical protein
MLKLLLVASLLSLQLHQLALCINEGSLLVLKVEGLLLENTIQIIDAS